MSRYGQTGKREEVIEEDGDAGIIGMDCASPPEDLEPGWCQLLVNKRLVNGKPMTRPGLGEHPSLNDPSFGEIYGSGVYTFPNSGGICLLIAVVDGVYLLRQYHSPVKLFFPEGVEIDDEVEFNQCFDKVVMLRGKEKETLEWSGDITENFTFIEQTGTGGTEPIPNGTTGLCFSDRFIMTDGRRIAVSDILNYTRFDSAFFEYSFNDGDGEEVKRFLSWQENTVIILKSNRIGGFFGFTGDLANSRIDSIVEKGVVGKKAAENVGADILFLGEGGLYRLLQNIQSRIEVSEKTISEKIQPLIDRINWERSDKAVMAVLGTYLYLAVPFEKSEHNNVVLVYNLNREVWESIDYYGNENGVGESAGLRILSFEKIKWDGRDKLAMVCNRVNGHGCVLIHEYGSDDVVGGIKHKIIDRFLSRVYTGRNAGFKAFNRCSIWLKTFNPFLSVSAVFPGVNERELLTPFITRNRKKYFLHGKKDFDPADPRNDPDQPDREDYSVKADEEFFIPESGLSVERMQESLERFKIRRQAEGVAIEITGSQGRLGTTRITVGQYETQRNSRTKI